MTLTTTVDRAGFSIPGLFPDLVITNRPGATLSIRLVQRLRPYPSQFLLIKEIHPRTVPADVEVLLQVPSFAKTHLNEVAPGVIAQQHFSAGTEQAVHVPHGLSPLCRGQRREDEDQENDIGGSCSKAWWEGGIAVGTVDTDAGIALWGISFAAASGSDIPDVRSHDTFIVAGIRTHELNGLLREIQGVQSQTGTLIVGDDRKGRVPSSGAELDDCRGGSIRLCNGTEDGKFLLQPFTVLEEIGRVVFVEEIPPLGWITVESSWAQSGLAAAHEREVAGEGQRGHVHWLRFLKYSIYNRMWYTSKLR